MFSFQCRRWRNLQPVCRGQWWGLHRERRDTAGQADPERSGLSAPEQCGASGSESKYTEMLGDTCGTVCSIESGNGGDIISVTQPQLIQCVTTAPARNRSIKTSDLTIMFSLMGPEVTKQPSFVFPFLPLLVSDYMLRNLLQMMWSIQIKQTVSDELLNQRCQT